MLDHYPSRNGNVSCFIDRIDPVVYTRRHGADADMPGSNGPLNQSTLDDYERDGFVILDDVFTEDEVALFQTELDVLRASPDIQRCDAVIREPGSDDVRSIFRVHAISALFQKLSVDNRLAGSAQQLLGDQVYIHQSRLNFKPGFRGKEFYWHSDFETWHVEDGMPAMRALSMSVTLAENSALNGPLLLIPGSHKSYLSCEGATPEKNFRTSLKQQVYGVPNDEALAQLVDAGGIVAATGKPGSVIIFDCNTMHGSNGNITPYLRSNIFFVYNAMSNRVVAPFCEHAPRPEYICTRENIRPIAGLSKR
ncbi:MAG: ectoine hydroxylase [Haliea sp.]|nr:ectoine hydroxylase [Haliea sp.]